MTNSETKGASMPTKENAVFRVSRLAPGRTSAPGTLFLHTTLKVTKGKIKGWVLIDGDTTNEQRQKTANDLLERMRIRHIAKLK